MKAAAAAADHVEAPPAVHRGGGAPPGGAPRRRASRRVARHGGVAPDVASGAAAPALERRRMRLDGWTYAHGGACGGGGGTYAAWHPESTPAKGRVDAGSAPERPLADRGPASPPRSPPDRPLNPARADTESTACRPKTTARAHPEVTPPS